jgi:hypothetical protein
MKDVEYWGLGVAAIAVLDWTAVPAIPRTSIPRARKGREGGAHREHKAAVARKGFMARERMQRYQIKQRKRKRLFDENIEHWEQERRREKRGQIGDTLTYHLWRIRHPVHA